MSIFTSILEKLGLRKPGAPTATTAKPFDPTKPQTSAPAAQPAPGTVPSHIPMPPSTPPSAAKPAPMAMVDVVSKLEKMAGDNPGLDWKVSIVDLLKLLGIDSSLKARKELAQELGCPPDLIGGDYSKMNIWLHKTVLQKIAENGGNIPQSLLD
jgi:hypothetical protein